LGALSIIGRITINNPLPRVVIFSRDIIQSGGNASVVRPPKMERTGKHPPSVIRLYGVYMPYRH